MVHSEAVLLIPVAEAALELEPVAVAVASAAVVDAPAVAAEAVFSDADDD